MLEQEHHQTGSIGGPGPEYVLDASASLSMLEKFVRKSYHR